MKTMRCLAITLLLAIVIVAPSLAQDTGIRDTLRFVPPSATWTINTEADSLFTFEMWGWSDQDVTGLSLPFIMNSGTAHDDSLIVSKTWVPAISAAIRKFSYSHIDGNAFPDALHNLYDGFLIGIVNIGVPLFDPNTLTKFGDLTITMLDAANASCEFDIVVDSLFFPPAGTFKFTAGTGYAPEFIGTTIHVVNNLCSAPADPTIGVDPASFTFNAVQGGSNPATQALNISNIGDGTLNWTVVDDAAWLTLNPASGTDAGSVTLTVDITGLTANTYNANITVSDPAATNDPVTVPVTLVVAPPPPTILVDPTSFTFGAVEGGSNPANQALAISNSGGGTLNWTVSKTQAWLTLNPASGSGNGSSTLSINITGLTAGTYKDTVTASDPAATNDPVKVPVTLNIAEPPPTIVLDPTSFTFNAVQDGANPSDQALNISNGGGGTLNWTAGDDAAWLTLAPASGSGDAAVAVQVDITGLTANTYSATITVSDPAASNSPQTASVELVVSAAPPTIVLDLDSLTFTAVDGGPNPSDQFIMVSNSGGGALSWTASEVATWLSVAPTTGTDDESFAVSVDLSTVTTGTYLTTIDVADPSATNSPQTAKVVLYVEEAPAMIVVTPTSFSFSGQATKADPPSQILSITNGGGGALNWTATNLEAWLSLDPTSGSAPSDVDVSVTLGSLPAGVYYDTIVVTSGDATNSPVKVPVMLTVSDAPTLVVDPNALDFTATVNGSNPSDQLISITSTDSPSTELGWLASNLTAWLSLDAAGGMTPSTLTASVDITGLAVGDYVDTITIMMPDGPAKESSTGDTVKVLVSLHVDNGNPEIDLNPSFFSFSWEIGSPAPASQALNITNVGTGILDWTLTTAGGGFWLDPDAFSGTAPSIVNLSVDTGPSLTAGMYYDTIFVAGNAFNSPQIAIAQLEVTEPPVLDEDTVWVGTATGMQGEDVVVPVIFKNIEELSGITLPLTFAGSAKAVNGLTCDSVSFLGTRVDYLAMKPVSIDNGSQTILVGAIVGAESLIPVGKGPMAYLHFTIDAAAPAGVVPIDSVFILPDNELLFADADGFPIYPQFVAGSIEIQEAPTPCLAINSDYFEFEALNGGPNPADQYLEITNCNAGTLDWTVSTKFGTWLSLDPTSGTGDGTVTMAVDYTGLVDGIYFDSITVDAGDATNSPLYVHVQLTITTPPPEIIAGTVELSNTDPVPSATVELWDMYPSGIILASTISDGSGAFDFGAMSGEYDIRAYKAGYYPTVEHVVGPDDNVVIVLNPTGSVMPTNEWIDLYCDDATLDEYLIQPGDVVEAYDPDGVLCGQWFVTAEGTFGFMAVYRDETVTTPGIDEGCDPGDEVTVKLNGFDVSSFVDGAPIIWTENGARIEACFYAYTIVEVCLDLIEGWNLISWNVDTESDDILDIIDGILPYVEVVLGFEQGAGTYDPDLPGFSTLFTLDHYHGYWVYVTQNVEFCVTGMPVDPSTPIYLENGWNLASYLPNVTYPTPDALASIYANVIIVLGFDGVGLTWDPANPGASDLTDMGPGFGYWIKLDADATLTYPANGPVAMWVSQPDNTSAKISTISGVVPTTQWIDVYGGNVTLDGLPIRSGSTIEAVDANGTVCGAFKATVGGKFGFMPVYGDDALTRGTSEGPTRNGTFHLVIDGIETVEEFTWLSHGDRIEVGSLNSLGGSSVTIPNTYTLRQNYPNPFNPSTSISYELGNSGDVRLAIYNLLGEEVKVLVNDYQSAGDYTIEWDGTDHSGRVVSSGVYFYKISAGDFTEAKKMMLMK
ncbi:MAG: T9SS type A sorting domain-containing protein [Candidatus Zixiibacteriota bacterium]